MKPIISVQEIVYNHFKQFENKYLFKKNYYRKEIILVTKVTLTSRVGGIAYMSYISCDDNKKHKFALTNLGFTSSEFFEMSEDEAIKQLTINKLK